MQNKIVSSPPVVRPELWISFFFCFAILAAYWPVQWNEFISYDDPIYLTENPWIKEGLTVTSIQWAFTTFYANFWHPLTWMSILLDVQLFEMDPGMHHLSAVFYHALSTLVLFYALRSMTGSYWRSAMVAGLFAVHPLHVESVAWASERKDVLSALFWMLTLMAWTAYAKRPTWSRYILVGFTFVLGLMAKPMLVTLPFVLLLLDYWPLGRIQFTGIESAMNPAVQPVSLHRLIFEKIPFLILSVVFSGVTYIAEKQEAITSFDQLPLLSRVLNGFISYVDYIQKMFIPTGLAVRYTYQLPVPLLQSLESAFFLLLISAGAVFFIRRKPYWFVGWFWYLGTLVPVIGWIQLGGFPKADRFTYLPSIGLSIALVWGAVDFLRPLRRTLWVGIGGFILLVYSMLTFIQVGYWHDNITLYSHVIAVTKEAPVAQNNLGVALMEMGRLTEAESHYREALRLRPNLADTHNNLANVLKKKRAFTNALFHYQTAIRLNPSFFEARLNLANLLRDQENYSGAENQYQEALKLQPRFQATHFNYAKLLEAEGKWKEAIAEYREVLRLNPDHQQTLTNLAWLLATCRDFPLQKEGEALQLATRLSVLIGEDDAPTLDLLSVTQAGVGRFSEALLTGQKALDLAHASQQNELAETIEKHLESYRLEKPWHAQP